MAVAHGQGKPLQVCCEPDLLDQIATIGFTPLPTRSGRIIGLYDTFIGTRTNRARNSIEAGPIVRVS